MSLTLETPNISVIVPVYNGEEYIYSCLDMLLQQTFECYEVIVVDNGSTDNSFSIAQKYAAQYPQKLFAYTIPHTDSPASGRNFGIKKARAEYIAFCDIDDMMSSTALKNYYDLLQNATYDIIYSPFWEISSRGKKLIVPNQFQNIGQIILNSDVAFWNKLIRKDLLLKTGDIPENTIFDDMAYLPVLLKNCKKIGYLNTPTYYHVVLDSSESRAADSPRLAQIGKSIEFALNGCDPRYIDQVMARFLKWLISSIGARWQFSDVYIKIIHEYYTYFVNNKYVKEDAKLYQNLVFYLSLRTDFIPQTIYLNSISGNYSTSDIEYLKDSSFISGAEIKQIGINELNENGDAVVQRLLSKHLIGEAVEYHILQQIYTNGGIYLGPELQKDAWLGSLLYFNAFFARENEETISSKFYGAKPKNRMIRDVLDTYTVDLWADTLPLEERFTCILVGKYRFALDSNTLLFRYDAALLAPEAIMFNIPSKLQRRYCHFKYQNRMPNNLEDYYIIEKRTFNEFLGRHTAQISKNQKKDTRASQELQLIKSSNSWKLLQWLKNRKNTGIGRIIYKVYLFICPRIIK